MQDGILFFSIISSEYISPYFPKDFDAIKAISYISPEPGTKLLFFYRYFKINSSEFPPYLQLYFW